MRGVDRPVGGELVVPPTGAGTLVVFFPLRDDPARSLKAVKYRVHGAGRATAALDGEETPASVGMLEQSIQNVNGSRSNARQRLHERKSIYVEMVAQSA